MRISAFHLIWVGFLFAFVPCANAQIDNSSLETPIVYEADSSDKKLSFKGDLFFYLKNNEYFNPHMDGFTLFGYWANPKISYRPHNKVFIDIGAFAARNFGNKSFDTLAPTLTVRIKEKNWNFLFGNIEANYQHKLLEPLYNFERGITKPTEQGFQAKYAKNETFLDTWIDWQKNTKPGKNSQEHIWAGLYYAHKRITQGAVSTHFPLQLNIFHYGGQNVPIKLPVRTIINAGLGNSLSIKLNASQKIVLDNHLLLYAEEGLKGSGYMGNLRFQSNRLQAIFTYWNGYKFEAPMGGDLYQSPSRKLGDTTYTNTRELAILRIIYNIKITPQMDLSMRIEPFYDFRSKVIEHSEGLYLVYRLPNIGLF